LILRADGRQGGGPDMGGPRVVGSVRHSDSCTFKNAPRLCHRRLAGFIFCSTIGLAPAAGLISRSGKSTLNASIEPNGTLQQVGEVLGHQDSRTNAPYAHFMSGPRLELADKTAITLRAYLEKQTRT